MVLVLVNYKNPDLANNNLQANMQKKIQKIWTFSGKTPMHICDRHAQKKLNKKKKHEQRR